MRLSCRKHWLLLGRGFAFLHGSAADETDIQWLGAAGGIGQNTDPQTFLGACPEYGHYASHKQ